MRKHLSIALLSVFMAVCLLVGGVHAAGTPYVVDQTGSLTDGQVSDLNSQAAQVDKATGVAPVFVISDDCDGQAASDYAAALGAKGTYGDQYVMTVINMDRKTYYIAEAGTLAAGLTDSQYDALWDQFSNADSAYAGIQAYITSIQTILTADPGAIPTDRQKQLVQDGAGLLTDSQVQALITSLTKISEARQCEVAVVTVNSLDGKTAQQYADDYYDYNGYGYGTDDSGVLLLIAMDTHDMAITTYGYGITAFTDYGIQYLQDQIRPDMSAGDYASALNVYAQQCDRLLQMARAGHPYDETDAPKQDNTMLVLGGSVIGGTLVALLVMLGLGSGMRTARRQGMAQNYIRPGSMVMDSHFDIFLYNRVSRTPKPRHDDGPSGGGGSSLHISSSGRSHGGGSSKF